MNYIFPVPKDQPNVLEFLESIYFTANYLEGDRRDQGKRSKET